MILSPFLLAACGDSGGTASQAFGARGASSIILFGHLNVGGTVSVSATFTDDISQAASAPTCAEAAKGFAQDGLRYALPRTPRTTSFDGHVVGVDTDVAGYHGPGAYDPPAVTGTDGATLLDIDGLGWAVVAGSTAHLTVNADDSGTFVFQKLGRTPPTPPPAGSTPAPAAAPAPGSITGTLTWTCATEHASATASPTPVPTTPAPPPATAAPTPARGKVTPTPKGAPATKGVPTPTPPH